MIQRKGRVVVIMTMPREEAISRIQDHMERHEIGKYPPIRLKEAFELALAALRGPTREMVERMRGDWIWHGEEVHCAAGNFPIKKCKQCKKEMLLDDYDNFCPACGAPMTDEAVDMVMERLEALYDKDM